MNETINEAGLCRENGGGALYEFEPVRDEVYFPVDVLDLVLRCCDTTLEAVELLTRYNLYWGPCNCVIGDAEGTGALIEKSTYHYAVRLSDRQVMVSTYGGCDDEDLRKLCDQTTPYFKYYERRLVVMKQVLAQAEAGDGLNLQAMWDCMLHHDPEAPGVSAHRNPSNWSGAVHPRGLGLVSGQGLEVQAEVRHRERHRPLALFGAGSGNPVAVRLTAPVRMERVGRPEDDFREQAGDFQEAVKE